MTVSVGLPEIVQACMPPWHAPLAALVAQKHMYHPRGQTQKQTLTSRGFVIGDGAFVIMLHVPANPLPVQGATQETAAGAVTYVKVKDGFKNGTTPTSTETTVVSCLHALLGFEPPLESQLVVSG
jgi:hypothetical protein